MHAARFTLECGICCGSEGYLQLQVELCVNPARLQGFSFSSIPKVCFAVGCSVNAYQDKTSPFFTVFMIVSPWLTLELHTHSPLAAAVNNRSMEAALAWSHAFLFGRSTSKTRADRGATNASAKGRSRQPHSQGSRSCCHFQLEPGSRVLPGALGQAEPAGNTPALCNKLIVPSSNAKACLSRRQSFLRLVWSCRKKFL